MSRDSFHFSFDEEDEGYEGFDSIGPRCCRFRDCKIYIPSSNIAVAEAIVDIAVLG